MFFQKLKTGCGGCLCKHLLQYPQSQQYKFIQERQLMHNTKNILYRFNIQGRQARNIKQLVQYFSTNRQVYGRLLLNDISRTRHLCLGAKNEFHRSVQCCESQQEKTGISMLFKINLSINLFAELL
jgi:hypothetical protein